MLASKLNKHLSKASKAIIALPKSSLSSNWSILKFTGQTDSLPRVAYVEEISKHRMKLPLYDLEPRNENCWIAPNATISMFRPIYWYSW